MGNRRLALVATSDDEDDAPAPPRKPRSPNANEGEATKKRKRVKLNDEEEGDVRKGEKREKKKRQREEDPDEEEPDEVPQEEARPIGEVTKVSGKGRSKRNHYDAFEYDGTRYELEDSVLLVPEETDQKPYVAIIKDITQDKDGTMMVTGQWFYRPEEADKKGGGNWQSSDTRELFYSFHRDEIPAESVMHKCVVHFIPLNKQIPKRKQHPGFIVQKVYDTEGKKLFKLTDKDYEDNKQHEIDLLVQKTLARLGDLPDIEIEDTIIDQEDQLKNKKLQKRKTMTPLDVSRDEETSVRLGQSFRAETPGSCSSNASEYYNILVKLMSLTGETQRDKWLERLLQAIRFICVPTESGRGDEKEKGGSNGNDLSVDHSLTKTSKAPQGNKARASFRWPDDAVPAVVALEKASHEVLSADFLKYNQKMRQLTFNLRNNDQLARRLLNGELQPSTILNMSPNELKEGLTAEEIARKEPEVSGHMQMTDARCRRCMEKTVGLNDIIQTGHGDRYQLECTACGNTWYASRDEVSTLTIDAPTTARSVGTAPLATAKFENVEKLVSPREIDKSGAEVLKKTTEAYMPILENQKSFNKTRTEDKNVTDKAE